MVSFGSSAFKVSGLIDLFGSCLIVASSSSESELSDSELSDSELSELGGSGTSVGFVGDFDLSRYKS